MSNLGPAGEFLRISEHYRSLSDGELIALAQKPAELTDVAWQALANEVSHRRLTVPPLEEPAARPTVVSPPEIVDPTDPEYDAYDEDRQLVQIGMVWSVRDALQVQNLLDTAGIPFFMGAERATGVDAVTSKFVEGVGVWVMNIGLPWAQKAVQFYEPKDDPTPKKPEKLEPLPVCCPKCKSEEVVFEELVSEPGEAAATAVPKFKWKCDSCGHEWEDDGVVEES